MPTPQWRPTKHERIERQEKRRVERAKAKRQSKLDAIKLDDIERRKAYDRDGGKCRATGQWLPFRHKSLLKVAHSHHVVYLSLGGARGAENRITVAWSVHKLIHANELEVTGDPATTVTFTLWNLETMKVVKSWDSTL